MGGHHPYVVSEWDWLQLRLEVMSLWTRTEHVRLLVDADDPGVIVCRLYCSDTDKMLEEGVSREEQLSYYLAWTRIFRKQIEPLVRKLPKLAEEFDFASHLVFEVLHQAGLSAYAVCEIRGEQVTWFEQA